MPPTTFDLDELISAYNDHDAERVANHYAEDAEIRRSALDEPLRGRDALRERAEMFLKAFPDFHIHLEEEVEAESQVAGVVRITGTHKGDLQLGPSRIPATGRTVEYLFAVIADLDDEGKIARETGIFDTAQLLKQLGVGPDALSAPSR